MIVAQRDKKSFSSRRIVQRNAHQRCKFSRFPFWVFELTFKIFCTLNNMIASSEKKKCPTWIIPVKLPQCYYFPRIKQNLFSEFATKLHINPCQVSTGRVLKSGCSWIFFWLIRFLVLPNKNRKEGKDIKLTYYCVRAREKNWPIKRRLASWCDYTTISGENYKANILAFSHCVQ